LQLSIVDCDVHPSFRTEWTEELSPYLPAVWQVRFGTGEQYKGRFAREWSGLRFTIPFNGSYPRTGSPVRSDLVTPEEPVPGSDPQRTSRELLDRYQVDRAVLLTQSVIGLGAMPNREAATVIAAATNDWMTDRWLSADSRYRGTITIAPQEPAAAAHEIERLGPDPRFAGVFFSPGTLLMGDPFYYPIYAAAERHRLPVTLHVTGAEGLSPTGPSLAGGSPTYHFDWRMNYGHPYQAYLASLIANGVFERFPSLVVVFTEIGFAWLPDLIWKMDSFWKSAREDTPWIKRLPSEYVREHCRFTSQPFIEPPHRAQIQQMLEMIHAEETLMFATDYPHWDFDDPVRTKQELPESMRSAVMVGNAVKTYGHRIL
jgi:uncharacterized protein